MAEADDVAVPVAEGLAAGVSEACVPQAATVASRSPARSVRRRRSVAGFTGTPSTVAAVDVS